MLRFCLTSVLCTGVLFVGLVTLTRSVDVLSFGFLLLSGESFVLPLFNSDLILFVAL